MTRPNLGNGPISYDVQHTICVATSYGAFEDVPAFFLYDDHIERDTGLTLVAIQIGRLTLSRAQYIVMTDETEHARQRALWNEWWWDEGHREHEKMLREDQE